MRQTAPLRAHGLAFARRAHQKLKLAQVHVLNSAEIYVERVSQIIDINGSDTVASATPSDL